MDPFSLLFGPRRAKRPPDGGVATLEKVRLGGIDQQIIINGNRPDLPILLVLHGGPGVIESGFYRVFCPELEEHFLVVHWDQRGGGRSYPRWLTGDDLRIDDYLSDIGELIDLLRTRYGPEKVYLLGHSWGSVIGVRYAARHPEDIHAYVGVAQIVSMRHGETGSYHFALRSARERGHREVVAELEEMGPPPYGPKEFKTQRKYVKQYGGSFHGRFDVKTAVVRVLRLPEFNLLDLYLMKRGYEFSRAHVWPQVTGDDLRRDLLSFDCPVYFFLGRHDHQVPSRYGAEYLDLLSAPAKGLTWFERSAHSPSLEEPERFVAALVALVATR